MASINSSLCCEITILAALVLKTFVTLVTMDCVRISNKVEQHFGLLSFLHNCHLSSVLCVYDTHKHTHTAQGGTYVFIENSENISY